MFFNSTRGFNEAPIRVEPSVQVFGFYWGSSSYVFSLFSPLFVFFSLCPFSFCSIGGGTGTEIELWNFSEVPGSGPISVPVLVPSGLFVYFAFVLCSLVMGCFLPFFFFLFISFSSSLYGVGGGVRKESELETWGKFQCRICFRPRPCCVFPGISFGSDLALLSFVWAFSLFWTTQDANQNRALELFQSSSSCFCFGPGPSSARSSFLCFFRGWWSRDVSFSLIFLVFFFLPSCFVCCRGQDWNEIRTWNFKKVSGLDLVLVSVPPTLLFCPRYDSGPNSVSIPTLTPPKGSSSGRMEGVGVTSRRLVRSRRNRMPLV